MIVEFLEKVRQRGEEEGTNYWFLVDGVELCVNERYGELGLYDSDGFRVSSKKIEDALFAEYEKHVDEF